MLARKHDRWITELPVPLLVFFVSLAILCWNAAPSVSFHDSGEFAIAAASGGIPHPPGAPTWVLLASTFLRLFHFDDPARGANVFTALCGSITLALLASIVQRWCRMVFRPPSPWIAPCAGLVAAAALLHSPAFIQQSTVAEQYTLLTAILAIMLLEVTAIYAKAAASEPGRRRWLALYFWLGATWGLAIGNHPSQVSLCFLVAWAVLLHMQRPHPWTTALRAAACCAAGLGTGLLIFLWVPLRSRANPFLDWGNVETLHRFIWSISRSQWQSRPLSDTPPGFILEWFATYDPLRQLGWMGFGLAAIGLAVLAIRKKVFLGWLLAAAVPYAAGMLIGHMRQGGIDIAYIRQYGVTDWHLPIYFAGAIATGVGFGWLSDLLHASKPRLAVLVSAFLLIGALVAAGKEVQLNSFRHHRSPLDLARTALAPLPDKAVILVRSDNLSNVLTYYNYFLAGGTNRLVIYDLGGIGAWISSASTDSPTTSIARTSAFLKHVMEDSDSQPYHLPPLSPQQINSSRIFMEYNPAYPLSAKRLLPRGFLFEILDRATADGEVMEADRHWRETMPQAWHTRQPDSIPLECEAWAQLYLRRAAFFQARELWLPAEESYRQSLEWSGTDGEVWYCLGRVCDYSGNAQAAAAAYGNAIVYAPHLPGPRLDLALIEAQAGHATEAEMLLLQELKLNPANKLAITNLAILRAAKR